jgi:hypothetical protein
LKAAKKISFIGTNKNASFVLFGFITFLLSQNNGMFWDAVLCASKIRKLFYYNAIFNWTISMGFDPVYLAFSGFLLAILWSSRLLRSSFILALFYQLYHFINYCIQRGSFIFLRFIMVLADPTLTKLHDCCSKLKTIDYLNKNTIETASILSFLPMKTTLNYSDLKNDERAFQEFTKKNEYVF